MPTDSYIYVPVLSSGSKVRTQTRTVGSDEVHEHFMQIVGLGTIKNTQTTIGDTATQIAVTPLTGRKSIIVKNLSTSGQSIFVGTATVTTLNGYELRVGESLSLDLDDTGTIYGIASSVSASTKACAMEIA